jgi:hypothetical protein
MPAKKEKVIRKQFKKSAKAFIESKLFNDAKKMNRKLWYMFLAAIGGNVLFLSTTLYLFFHRG